MEDIDSIGHVLNSKSERNLSFFFVLVSKSVFSPASVVYVVRNTCVGHTPLTTTLHIHSSSSRGHNPDSSPALTTAC